MTGQSKMPFMASSRPDLISDYIATPPAVLDALLDSRMPPPRWPILDPCAGGGAILRRLLDRGWKRDNLFAIEAREEEIESLGSVAIHIHHAAWTALRRNLRYDCPECGGVIARATIDPRHALPRCCPCCLTFEEETARPWRGWPASVLITNPPYSQIPAFPLACLSPELPGRMRYVALLMPVEELSGVKRCKWLAEYPPTGMVHLSWRPFPNVRGVAWYVWERSVEPLRLGWA